ncbi:hypothetical protein BDZ94DRAFT_451935 [Collybia nuda]|uniref:Uncharacterized protein n=1 Tax=Collybia nuda TaxID=64659 RepID=A0A9P5YC18_9AGAR|nr:hypothetical protein BDZ94DRAFT_451935 [Collybia nuda]
MQIGIFLYVAVAGAGAYMRIEVPLQKISSLDKVNDTKILRTEFARRGNANWKFIEVGWGRGRVGITEGYRGTESPPLDASRRPPDHGYHKSGRNASNFVTVCTSTNKPSVVILAVKTRALYEHKAVPLSPPPCLSLPHEELRLRRSPIKVDYMRVILSEVIKRTYFCSSISLSSRKIHV